MRLFNAVWLVTKSYIASVMSQICRPFFAEKKTSARELDFTSIRYSQLWEDGRTLRRGLGIGDGDVVLSIAAAGDNALGLLLDNPSRVVAVDISPAQIALVSLKIHAIKHISYEEFTILLGFQLDDVMATSSQAALGLSRREVYRKLRPFLPEETRDFWDGREAVIDSGIVHAGRLERFFQTFRTCLRAFGHSEETMKQLLEPKNPAEQRSFFTHRWDTWLWRTVHRYLFSAVMLGRARDTSLVQRTSIRDVSAYMLDRHNDQLKGGYLSDNFFEEYILLGHITGRRGLPDYLKRENYDLLRQRVDRVELLQTDLFEYLEKVASTSQLRFDAFNLSDLFEWFSPSVGEGLLGSLVKVSNPGARLAYWNFLNYRRRPESLASRLEPQTELARELHMSDRMWPYSDFVLETVV